MKALFTALLIAGTLSSAQAKNACTVAGDYARFCGELADAGGNGCAPD